MLYFVLAICTRQADIQMQSQTILINIRKIKCLYLNHAKKTSKWQKNTKNVQKNTFNKFHMNKRSWNEIQYQIIIMKLKEIYHSATTEQRSRLIAEIINDGVSVSTAHAWCYGLRMPKQLYKESIRRHVQKCMGINVTVEELFPESRRRIRERR